MLKHKHHIIPRHMGGTDDPSNIVELTIEEHAEAHRILYETYGNEKDKVAWQGLSGLISKSDVMRDLHRLGRKKADDIIKEKYGIVNPGQLPHNRRRTSEQNKRLHAEGKLSAPDWTGKKHKDETKRLIGMKNSISQAGSKNSQFGTMWITNGTENKKINKEELDKWVSLGYTKGRICGVRI